MPDKSGFAKVPKKCNKSFNLCMLNINVRFKWTNDRKKLIEITRQEILAFLYI